MTTGGSAALPISSSTRFRTGRGSSKVRSSTSLAMSVSAYRPMAATSSSTPSRQTAAALAEWQLEDRCRRESSLGSLGPLQEGDVDTLAFEV